MKRSNMAGIAVALGATFIGAVASGQELYQDSDELYLEDVAEPEPGRAAPSASRPEASSDEPSTKTAPIQRTWPTEPQEAPPAKAPSAQARLPEQAPSKPARVEREPVETLNERTAARVAPRPSVASMMALMNADEAARALRSACQTWLASADGDGDAMVSRQEALAAAQELMGGLFFRADKNHDGRLSPIELRAARGVLLREHATLRALMSAPRSSSFSMRQLLTYLDVRNERWLSVGEANLATSSAVDALFAMSDLNHDGRIAVSELQTTANKLSLASARSALEAADLDRNGVVSVGELEEAMGQAIRRSFIQMDRNADGALSPDEVLRVAEPKRPLAANTELLAREPAPAPESLDLNRDPTGR